MQAPGSLAAWAALPDGTTAEELSSMLPSKPDELEEGGAAAPPPPGGGLAGSGWPRRVTGAAALLGAAAAVALLVVAARSLGETASPPLRAPAATASVYISKDEAPNMFDDLPTTKCKKNTFFIDWGSSGMKIYPVHHGDSDGKLMDIDKAEWEHVGPDVSEKALLCRLNELSTKLAPGHVGAAVKATAGFRLKPRQANATWTSLRTWNEKHKLFAKCHAKCTSSADCSGCHTLAGVEEARYETMGMVDYAHEKKKDLGDRFGMLSCGGASIQLGLWGAPADLGEKCIADLGNLSSTYDPKRTTFNEKTNRSYLSWLANHNAPMSVHGHSDYLAGGVNEMRARFDTWLTKQGEKTNPCVAHYANSAFTSDDVCDTMLPKGTPCLFDKYGGYMTSLHGRPGTDREQCRKSAESFAASDMMLSSWSCSDACQKLAAGIPEWGLLTSFSRSNQLGADISDGQNWSSTRDGALLEGKSEVDFETEEDVKKGKVGEVLTSSLLLSFLKNIGLSDDAQVSASDASVASVAMKDFGLTKGWLAECS